VFVLLGWFYSTLQAGGLEEDRKEDKLRGPVQSIRTEAARFSKESGKLVEGKKELVSVVSYNFKGKRIEEISGQSSIVGLFEGVSYGKKHYTYDSYGRIAEIRVSRPDNSLLKKIIFTRDALGRLMMSTSEDYDRPTIIKTTYTYDDQGRLMKEESDIGARFYSYNSKGLLEKETSENSMLIHAYDALGHRISATSYSAHDQGLGIDKVVTKYDVLGNMISITTYYTRRPDEEEGQKISPPNTWVYTYEYDSYGNWIKQLRWDCTTPEQQRRQRCKPSLVAYRTISYYSEAALRKSEERFRSQ
jgi:YD repeat-containing protein